jgi:hypothetical protein
MICGSIIDQEASLRGSTATKTQRQSGRQRASRMRAERAERPAYTYTLAPTPMALASSSVAGWGIRRCCILAAVRARPLARMLGTHGALSDHVVLQTANYTFVCLRRATGKRIDAVAGRALVAGLFCGGAGSCNYRAQSDAVIKRQNETHNSLGGRHSMQNSPGELDCVGRAQAGLLVCSRLWQ